jgi:hypothetical protein
VNRPLMVACMSAMVAPSGMVFEVNWRTLDMGFSYLVRGYIWPEAGRVLPVPAGVGDGPVCWSQDRVNQLLPIGAGAPCM